MPQFNFQDNILYLKVKRSPLVIRMIFLLFALMFFLLPLIGMILSISAGSGFTFKYFIGVTVCLLSGFYLLRIFLWNTYGEERMEMSKHKINYEANYGWFKDGKKEMDFEELTYSVKLIGYEDENKGTLVIASSSSKLESVVKMPIPELEELIGILKTGSIINK